MVINKLMADEDVLYMCVCVSWSVLFPGRHSIPLTVANELWDLISINTTLVSTINGSTHTHTVYKYNPLAHTHTCANP